jgi:hypothetical protein
MKPKYEGCNELWNGFLGFWQTGYAENKAQAHGWPDFWTHNWVGKTLSTIGQAASACYSGDRSRYDVIVGFQTGTGASDGDVANSVDRLTSRYYVADGVAQSGYTASAAKDWITAGTVATYYNPGYYTDGSGTEAAFITEWLSASASRKLEIEAAYVDAINSPTATFGIVKLREYYVRWKALLQTYGIQQMFGYEGGYSPDLTSNGASDADHFRLAAKVSPRMRDYLLSIYDAFTSMSDDTFKARFPSQYLLGGDVDFSPYPPHCWGALDDIYTTADPPIWQAIKAYNSARRAIPLRLRIHG